MSDSLVKITGTKAFMKKLEYVHPMYMAGLLDKMAFDIENTILDDTSKGVDIDGKKFTPYKRDKHGNLGPHAKKREKKGLSTSKVDLLFEDEMLSSISHEVFAGNDPRATIGFSDESQALKAMGHNEGTNKLPQRRFFGVAPARVKVLLAAFRKELNQYFRKHGL